MDAFRSFKPEIMLIDVRLGGVSGLDILEQVKSESPEIEAVILTAYGSVEIAVDAMKRGAAEFLLKPIDLEVLAVTIDRIWSASQARRQLEQFRSAQAERLRQVQFLGHCEAIQSVRDRVQRLADRAGSAGGDLPAILLTGETGTGKDLLASYIHAALPNRSGPFVALNCSAVPGDLFESELFGHQQGAFSGATADKPGLFETANEGTLFLDEIGDLPLALQPKLLRALETRAVRRIGDQQDRAFDLCMIAATNRKLAEIVEQNRFRQDLYYRLKVVTIELPPLRERGDDVLLLADAFCNQLAAKYNLPGLTLSQPARQSIQAYRWPGNVRELQHALEAAALSVTGTQIEPAHLPLAPSDSPLQQAKRSLANGEPIHLEEVERALIEQALAQTDGNVSAAARLLSIGREALRYRMAKFGLKSEAEGDAD
jgi:DNA-binding NtrC family response regulator